MGIDKQHSPESTEETITFEATDEIMAMLINLGDENTLKIYRLEGIGRIDRSGKKPAIVCPRKRPKSNLYINVLPEKDLDIMIQIMGSQEAVIQFYRDLRGYKGALKLVDRPSGGKTLQVSDFSDTWRSLPGPVKAGMLGISIAIGGALFKSCHESPTGMQIENAIEDRLDGDRD